MADNDLNKDLNNNLNTEDTADDYISNDDLDDEIEEAPEEKEDNDKVVALPLSKKIRYIVLGVSVIVIIFSLASLIKIFSEYHRGEDIYESIQNIAFVNEHTTMAPEGTVAETTAFESISYAEIETDAPLEKIDMWAVKSLSSNAIGWIQIPAIGRSYPVAQTDNNSYYLNHTFTGEENNAGCIFMDCRNYSDYSDKNTIIYGHNMYNGTMFGMLNRFEKQEFYNENNTNFYITTTSGVRAYKIAAVMQVPSDCILYRVEFGNDVTFSDVLNYISENKMYSTGVSLLPTDYIVTLSTCTSDSSTRRVVIGKYIGTIKE